MTVDSPTTEPEITRSSRVGTAMLWALSVGASVGGIFSGWNPGLAQAGFGGMLVATLVAIMLYLFLVMSIAELAVMMPFAGGTVNYARTAFGVWGGFLAAISALIAYTFAMTSLMGIMTTEVTRILVELNGPNIPAPVLWAVFLLGFGWLNLKDRRTFFIAALVLALVTLAVLFVTAIAVVPSFEPAALLSIPANLNGNEWLPHGLLGIAFAIPFAMWFFLSIEVVSYAAEDALTPDKSVPRSLLMALLTLAVCALIILTVLSGAKPGALMIAKATDPLSTSLEVVFGKMSLLYLVPLIGAVAGFHSVIYSASRVVFSLSRSGYLPSGLSTIADNRGTPVKAGISVCVVVYAISCLTLFAPANVKIVEMLINMAAIGGLLTYIFVFASYVKLHASYPKLERPFTSTFGGTGAIAGLMMTAVGLLLMVVYAQHLSALLGCLGVFLVAIVLFFIFRPKHLRADSPDEIYARALQNKSSSLTE